MTGTLTFLKEFRPAPPAITDEREIGKEKQAEEAYRDGFAAGVEQARAEFASEAVAAIDRMTEALRDATRLRDSIARGVNEEAGSAVAAVVRGICPCLAAAGAAEAAKSLVIDELENVPRPVVIKVSGEAIEALTESLGGYLDADTTIEADDGLGPSQIGFEWVQGSASIDVDGLVTRISALADSLGTEPKADQQGET